MHILLTDILRCPHCGPEFGLILLADRMEERRVSAGTLGCPNCRRSYPIEAGVADLRLSGGSALGIAPPVISDIEETAFRVAALLGAQQANANVLLLGSHLDIGARLAAIFPEAHIVMGSGEAPARAQEKGGSAPPAGAERGTTKEAPEVPSSPGALKGGVGSGAPERREAVGRASIMEPTVKPDEAAERAEFSVPTGTLSRTLHGGQLPFATGAFTGVAILGSPAPALLPELLRVLHRGGRLVVEGALAEVDPALRTLGFDIILNQDATVVAALLNPR